MTSIGETLRRERMRRNLELDRISKDLKISTKLLEAMEADRFDKLPGGVFTRSFVRQYARHLGLDDQEIVAALQRMLEPPPVQPEVSEAKPRAAVHTVRPRVKNLVPEGRPNFPWSSSLRALAMVVVVVLVCSALYSWSQRGRRPIAVHSNPPAVAQAATPPQPVAVEPAKTPPEAEAAPRPPRIEETVAGSAERLDGAPVRVQLTAEEPVWVLATKDGKYAFSGIIAANDSRIVEASDRVFLKIGNAGGVLVWLNGKQVGKLGAEGEVRRVQFTSGGFQIVPVEAPTAGDSGTEPDEAPKEPLAPL